jgi:hypothetical protein
MTLTYRGTFTGLIKYLDGLNRELDTNGVRLYYEEGAGYEIENMVKGIKIHTHDENFAKTIYENEVFFK